MNLDKAIIKVGKAMGGAKFDDAMGGAMLPDGNIDAAKAISLIYGVSYEEVRSKLNRLMNEEYKKKCEEHNASVKRKGVKNGRRNSRKRNNMSKV